MCFGAGNAKRELGAQLDVTVTTNLVKHGAEKSTEVLVKTSCKNQRG